MKGPASRATLLLSAALTLAGCHAQKGPPGVDSLGGLTLPLVSSPALRLVVAGTLADAPAEVAFDPSQPVSFISSKCVPEASLFARVSVPDAFGPDETFAVTRVAGLTLGATRFRTFEAAVGEGKHCVVVLGAPELSGLALEVSPVARTVRFRPSQTREQWAAEAEASGEDAQVFSLTKEPRYDWPLLSVRMRQGPQRFDATLLFSLREVRSRVFEASATAAGLKPGARLLEGLPLPQGAVLPPGVDKLKGYAWDTLELAPGFGLSVGSLEPEPGAPPHAAQGVLGADVWGRFFTTYDVASSTVVLRRPRVFVAGNRATCERGGAVNEEACFDLHATPTTEGVDVTAVVWRPLPYGAQLSLDVTGGAGTCRIGMTFSPGDRGRSTQHSFPWRRVADGMPGCKADAFKGVTAVTLGFLDESTLPQCPGVCGFARDAQTGKLTCECQAFAGVSDGETTRRLLELYQRALEERPLTREDEPKDPE